MSESRDKAIKAGAEALVEGQANPPAIALHDAGRVLDAAHKAGLISYRDEWEQVGWQEVNPGVVTDGRLRREDDMVMGGGDDQRAIPVFVRRDSVTEQR